MLSSSRSSLFLCCHHTARPLSLFLRHHTARPLRRSLCDGSAAKSLVHKQILHFAEMVRPSERERRARAIAISRTRDVVRAALPGAELHQFGSTSTSIALPGSDLDLVAIYRPDSRRSDPFTSLRKVRNEMRRSQLHEPKKQAMLLNAKVPLLKFTERESGMPIDLSCNSLDGLRNSQAIRVAIQFRPELQPLILVVKTFLKQRGLNETFNGGIGSYLLFAMALQKIEPRTRSTDLLEAARQLGQVAQLRVSLGEKGSHEFLSEQTVETTDVVFERPQLFQDYMRAGEQERRGRVTSAGVMDDIDDSAERQPPEAPSREEPPDPSQAIPANRLEIQNAAMHVGDAGASVAAACAGETVMRFLMRSPDQASEGERVFEQAAVLRNLSRAELREVCGKRCPSSRA
eukprot:scaffold9654_cov31-Tisochrysis_lutea.AAC.1